jgi:hypothetical protein
MDMPARVTGRPPDVRKYLPAAFRYWINHNRKLTMNTSHAAVVLATAVALGGCGPTVRSARFIDAAPLPADQHVALFSTRLPTCPYTEIGLIVVGPSHGFASLQGMLDSMRQRAREMGGGAIAGVATPQRVDGEPDATASTRLSGTVIRFERADCTS